VGVACRWLTRRGSWRLAQGQEFWNAAGFVGTFSSDYHDDLEDDEDEGEGEDDEDGVPWSRADAEFNDDEPVFEIYEPVDGGEAKIVTHASQKAFEEADRLGTPS
jgi:hypothetical protein